MEKASNKGRARVCVAGAQMGGGTASTADPAQRQSKWSARRWAVTVLVAIVAGAIVTFMVIQAVRNRPPPGGEVCLAVQLGGTRTKRKKRGGHAPPAGGGAATPPPMDVCAAGAEEPEGAEGDADAEGEEGKVEPPRVVARVGSEGASPARWRWQPLPDADQADIDGCFLSAVATFAFVGRMSTPLGGVLHSVCSEGTRLRLAPAKSEAGLRDRALLVRHAGMPPQRFMLCLLRGGGGGLAMVEAPSRDAAEGPAQELRVAALPTTLKDLEAQALCVDVRKARSPP